MNGHAAALLCNPQPVPSPSLEALLGLADAARQTHDPLTAGRHYSAILADDPNRREALLSMGVLHVQAGRAQDAHPLLARCCALHPTDADAQHALGIALLLLNQPREAQDALATGYALNPENALCAVHLADAAHALDLDHAAAAVFVRARALWPAGAAPLCGHAACLNHLGRRDAAIDALEAASLIDPACAVAAAMLADALARTTRQAEADEALTRARALDPANVDLAMAHTVVMMRLHRHADAAAVLEALLETGAAPVGPLCNLSTALVSLGRQEEAVARAHEAIAAAPGHAAPYRALCNALPYRHGVTGRDLLAAAIACSARQPRGILPPCVNDPDPNRPLRIGLLSGTLRTHPVGWLTVAGFEALDPASFRLLCFSPNPPTDAFGKRFAAIAEQWHDIFGLDDLAVAQAVRDCGIDILIDLGGYGDFGRMQALTHRAAPVQVKWVGMQNHSSGLAEMDWFITDRWETPPDLAPLYSERLLSLPDGYVCYSPPPDAPPVAPLPALTRGHVTFGCTNNLAKITPPMIAVWARILRAVPDAAMILQTHQFSEAETCTSMREAFAGAGIAADRLRLRGSTPHRGVLAGYAQIDIVLDPHPYSGGLTTCEALWMGVPTITMPGESFASRHSASHMSNVGLADWVVPDIDHYIAQAVQRAADLDALATLRAGLRARTAASPLCDAPRFGAALGASLREAWRDWCKSAAPDLVLHASLPLREHSAA